VFTRNTAALLSISIGIGLGACWFPRALAGTADTYEPKEIHGINLVGFSELLSHTTQLDTKPIQIIGYCARLSYKDSDTLLFSSRDAADHLNIREAVALRYSGGKGPGVQKEAEFKNRLDKLNNRFCTVRGRYSADSVFVLGSDVDRGIPTSGIINADFVSGGMMREDVK